MSKSNSEKLFEYVRELGSVPLTRIEKRYVSSEWEDNNIYLTGSVEDGYAPPDRIGLQVFFDRFNDLTELKRKIYELDLFSVKEELLRHIPRYELTSSRFENNLSVENKEKFFEEHCTASYFPNNNTERINIYNNTKNSLKWLTKVETPEELYTLFKRLRNGLKKKDDYDRLAVPEGYSRIQERGLRTAGYYKNELMDMVFPNRLSYKKKDETVFRFIGDPFPELKYTKKLCIIRDDGDLLNNAIWTMEILENYILSEKEQNLYPWNRFSR